MSFLWSPWTKAKLFQTPLDQLVLGMEALLILGIAVGVYFLSVSAIDWFNRRRGRS